MGLGTGKTNLLQGDNKGTDKPVHPCLCHSLSGKYNMGFHLDKVHMSQNMKKSVTTWSINIFRRTKVKIKK